MRIPDLTAGGMYIPLFVGSEGKSDIQSIVGNTPSVYLAMMQERIFQVRIHISVSLHRTLLGLEEF